MGYIQRAGEWGDVPLEVTVEQKTDSVRIDKEARAKALFRFRIGSCVTHKERKLQSLIVAQIKTSNGLEIYSLRSYAEVDSNRYRLVLADSLRRVVAGSDDCKGCLLSGTDLCPGA